MGAAQKYRRNFLTENPTCYYCGYSSATTIDHVPSRECFKDRVGPEQFEFPACDACNQRISGAEQVAALYIRLFDFNEDHMSERQIKRLMQGVANNNPECLPTELSANAKRKGLKQGHLHVGNYSHLAELSMVGLPKEGHAILEKFSRKLPCALYYKHCNKPIPLDYSIMSMALFMSERRADAAVRSFVEMLPDYLLSKRVNTNIGEQFHYKWGVKDDGELFAFVSQFSQSIYVIGGVARTDDNNKDHWKPHREDFIG